MRSLLISAFVSLPTRLYRILPGPVPTELLQPTKPTVGVRLLGLMGWREGQTLREATKAREKREQKRLDKGEEEEEEGDVAKQTKQTAPAAPAKRTYGLQISLDELVAERDEAAIRKEKEEEVKALMDVRTNSRLVYI